MYLYCDLADTNFGCYLFVHFAQCHQCYDVALTQRKGLEAGSYVDDRPCVIALGMVAIERNSNCVQKVLLADRLRQEFDSPSLHSLDCHRDIAMSGNKDNGNINV